MKKYNFIKYPNFLVVLIAISSFTVTAGKIHQQKNVQAAGGLMQLKCFVEYHGGGNDIRFVTDTFTTPSQAIKVFQGRKVKKGNSEKVIYKVKECVETRKKFSNGRARQLDKGLLR